MALPVTELRARLAEQTWTAHNLDLGGGTTTIHGREDFLTEDMRLLAIDRTLTAILGQDRSGRSQPDLGGRRVLDLGSLEGGFALAMAQRGAEVVAVEARAQNVDKLRLVQEHLEVASLQVVHDDVKAVSAARLGRFDVVLALGILYHLDEPVRWLHQVAGMTEAVLIVDTHMAPARDDDLDRLRPDLRHLGRLQLTIADGLAYEGRWFEEMPPTISEEGREQQLWASWSNDRSFWLTEEALLRALLAVGFDLVYEQHDLTAGSYRTFTEEFPRATYVCVRLGEGDT